MYTHRGKMYWIRANEKTQGCGSRIPDEFEAESEGLITSLDEEGEVKRNESRLNISDGYGIQNGRGPSANLENLIGTTSEGKEEVSGGYGTSNMMNYWCDAPQEGKDKTRLLGFLVSRKNLKKSDLILVRRFKSNSGTPEKKTNQLDLKTVGGKLIWILIGGLGNDELVKFPALLFSSNPKDRYFR
ncbi:hypothetical protein Tco_0496010 [Tanacetum coccineum]